MDWCGAYCTKACSSSRQKAVVFERGLSDDKTTFHLLSCFYKPSWEKCRKSELGEQVERQPHNYQTQAPVSRLQHPSKDIYRPHKCTYSPFPQLALFWTGMLLLLRCQVLIWWAPSLPALRIFPPSLLRKTHPIVLLYIRPNSRLSVWMPHELARQLLQRIRVNHDKESTAFGAQSSGAQI